MAQRVRGKIAIIVGGGQTPGDTIGNGRAMAILFAREGAHLLLVDRRPESAEETRNMIEGEGGTASVLEADIRRAEDCKNIAAACVDRYGRIDILVNNAGTGRGDGGAVTLSEEAWDAIFNLNLKAIYRTCKYVLPVMEAQQSGVIINISSIAAICAARMLAYKASKAGVNALTHMIAMTYARKGIRCNAVMPGLMETPMAIEGISKALGVEKSELIKKRGASIPLKGGMGTAWDTAYAALFLASDEAKFITSVMLPVDGGQSARIG